MSKHFYGSDFNDEAGNFDPVAWEEYQNTQAPLSDLVFRTEAPVVGDVTSTAIGSAARYNAGKPPFDLLPLSIVFDVLGPEYDDMPAAQCLFWLGQFQQEHDNTALRSAFREMYRDKSLYDQLKEVSAVLEYGRRKYSNREDCTCGVYQRKNGIGAGQSIASGTETIPSTQRSVLGKTPIGVSGTSETRNTPRPWNVSAESDVSRTRIINGPRGMPASGINTASAPINTTPLSPVAAQSAVRLIDLMSIMTTNQERSEGYSAIPATLALDLSRGLEAGLREHSPTCGVHQVRNTGAWNWSKGQMWSVALACAARHLVAILAGEETDVESGQPHRAHVATNLLFLLTFVDTYPEGNDLPTTLRPRLLEEETQHGPLKV